MADMFSPAFEERVGDHISEANRTLEMLGAAALDPSPVCAQFREYAGRLKPYIADISIELDAAMRSGKVILVEAAQGTLLDVDFGTYPFVTSSSTTASGALTGLGLGLGAARDASVIGVVKAFQTRVGSGPFPTELSGDLATCAAPAPIRGTNSARPPAGRAGWAGWTASCCAMLSASTALTN
jgi:adenylosuccinate synthase